MPLSLSEESYLASSLSLRPPCRPDGRDQHQFRPLDASAGILPATNGSARIRLCDGGECIVGIKAEVVESRKEDVALVEVQCDIAGVQSNSPLHTFLCTTLETALRNTLPASRLSIIHRYTYKLFIDGIILDHVSHPLTLFSMTVYLALLDTRLPKLIPSADVASTTTSTSSSDQPIGLPQFESDWQESVPLCDKAWSPPLVQLAVLAGKNVFVDPTGEEAGVGDGAIVVSWHQGKVVGLRTVNTRDSSKQVFSASRDVTEALTRVVS
ncbi:polyribonucleotide nucleotidyltransferase [Myxozyma melibiosi]|uniref:Ribosomal RNA-processing protein 42 n=1 Tax=Myxozyma melibiosi TaxID=54550 RepID=A0ABR1EXR9_9ASCO